MKWSKADTPTSGVEYRPHRRAHPRHSHPMFDKGAKKTGKKKQPLLEMVGAKWVSTGEMMKPDSCFLP